MPDSDRPLTPPAAGHRVFIDFDNTITRGDVLDGLIERFAADDRWRSLEEEWAAGRIGARACLEGQMLTLRGTWPDFLRHLDGVDLDPGFGRLREVVRAAGIELTIVSDNFDRFIGAILPRFGFADIAVYANHVEFDGDRLRPSFPYLNPECPGCAHCKKTHFVPRGRDNRQVVYIGDGRSDICPALQADIVFAKAGLLSYLVDAKIPCRPFAQLEEVAADLAKIINEDRR